MVRSSAAKITRNSSLLFLATFLRMVMSFAFVVYSAALLGVAGFGKYNLVIHYFELFLSLCASGIAVYLTREAAKRSDRIGELLSHAYILLLILIVIAAIMLTIIFQLAGYSPESIVAMRVATVALIPAVLGVVLEAALVAIEEVHFVTIGTVIEGVVRFGGGFAVLYYGGDLVGLFTVLIAARIVMAFYYWSVLRRRVSLQLHFRAARFRVMLARWRVFAAENWLATIYTNLDVVVLSLFHGEVAVGLYAAAWRFVRLGAVAAKSYTTAVFPVLARLHQRSQMLFDVLNQTTLRIMIAAAIPVAAVITILAPQLINLLYGAEYANSIPVLRVLIWVMVLECINPFLSYTLFAQGAQHKSMRVAAIALSVNLFATLLLVMRYGAVGAALGTIVGGLVAACCYCLLGIKPAELRKLLRDSVKIALASAALAFVVLTLSHSACIGGLAAGGILYMVLLVAFRVITSADLQLLRSEF